MSLFSEFVFHIPDDNYYSCKLYMPTCLFVKTFKQLFNDTFEKVKFTVYGSIIDAFYEIFSLNVEMTVYFNYLPHISS